MLDAVCAAVTVRVAAVDQVVAQNVVAAMVRKTDPRRFALTGKDSAWLYFLPC